MQQIYSTQAASISELKRNPSKLIREANGKALAILNHNVAAAYLLPAETYEKLLDMLDDKAIEQLVGSRISSNKKSIKVNIDDL